MKTLTYKYEDMQQVVSLMNSLHFCGIQQARIVSQIGDLLDSGMVGEIMDKEGEKHDSDRNDDNNCKRNME